MSSVTFFFTPPLAGDGHGGWEMVLSQGEPERAVYKRQSFLQKEKKPISPSVLETEGFPNLSWLISTLHPVGERRPVPYQHFARSRL